VNNLLEKFIRKDKGNWQMKARLSKYHEDITPFAREGREAEFHKLFTPYEVIKQEGNCLLNSGINEMWDLVTGAASGASHIYDNDAATIGVGDSGTDADPAQTDLQAAVNKTYKAMEGGYPTSTSQKATFKSSFGSSDANYAWEEWVVKQATSTICLNRKVESLGTKSSGTWSLEVDITLS
jgi:hypothetical protein